MPTYNRAHIIAQAIDSMLRQSFIRWELVIVDDCSTDDTKSVVEGFMDRRIRYVRLTENRGAAFCRNYGFMMATTKYVGFLDSDDVFHANKLQRHWELFNSGDFDCTVSGCELQDYTRNEINVQNNIKPASSLVVEFINKTVVWKMYPVWVKEFLARNRITFHEQLKNSQDYQFNAFAVINAPRVGYILESLGTKNEYSNHKDPHRIGSQVLRTSLKNHLLSRKLVLDYAKRNGVPTKEKKQIGVYVRRHMMSCLYAAWRESFGSFFGLLFYAIALWTTGSPIHSNVDNLRGHEK